MLLLPPFAPSRINDARNHRNAVEQACVGIVLEKLFRFELHEFARETCEMFFSATAVICDHLLPIDGATDANPPFVERLSNAMCVVMPTASKGSLP